jgi:phosphoglycolate phosphatase
LALTTVRLASILHAMRLLLFDIDGTLVNTGGSGKRALNRACFEVLGITGALDTIPLSGRTDFSLLREVLTANGLEVLPKTMQEILTQYCLHLAQEISIEPAREKWVLPNVRPLLTQLEPLSRLGVATGNIEDGARLKLQAVELEGFFPVGGFGSDAEERSALVLAGAQKARYFYQEPLEEVAVIGDTPLDIFAAKAHGFLAIGVATGTYSVEQLQQAGADRVLRSFEAINVLEVLLA